jgi:hypothetical protein
VSTTDEQSKQKTVLAVYEVIVELAPVGIGTDEDGFKTFGYNAIKGAITENLSLPETQVAEALQVLKDLDLYTTKAAGRGGVTKQFIKPGGHDAILQATANGDDPPPPLAGAAGDPDAAAADPLPATSNQGGRIVTSEEATELLARATTTLTQQAAQIDSLQRMNFMLMEEKDGLEQELDRLRSIPPIVAPDALVVILLGETPPALVTEDPAPSL